MKTQHYFLALCLLLFSALQAQSWQSSTYGFYINPLTNNLGLGVAPSAFSKLELSNVSSSSSTLSGLKTTVRNDYSGSGASAGILNYSYTGTSSTGVAQGIYSHTISYNTASTAETYGLQSYTEKSGNLGVVYGVYSRVVGGERRWAGYFTGGDVYVSGKIGIANTNPNTKLDVCTKYGLSVAGENIDSTYGYDLTFLKNSGRLLLGWNYSGGRGECDFISNREAGNGGGFSFYDYSNSGAMTHIMRMEGNGNVGIGTMYPGVKLDVLGVARAYEVRVCLNQGCDYVFDDNYNLMSINDLRDFVLTNKHLPEVAPAAQMEDEGINVSEMSALLLKKVEELTLYIIELEKRMSELEAKKGGE